jgi:hypothetical protein
MRLREHPKIQWPPRWGESSLRAEEGILREVDLIDPMKLLISNEVDRKVYFAEIYCSNSAFRLPAARKNQGHCRETDKKKWENSISR